MKTQTVETGTMDTTTQTNGRSSIDLTLRMLFAATLAVFLGSLLYAAQPAPTPLATMHFDGPTFDSVQGLSWNSDVVVRAKVTKVLGPQMDFGGEKRPTTSPDGEEITRAGLAVMLYQVEVQDALAGKVGEGENLTIALLNHKKIDSEHTVEINQGDEYLFFMSKMAASDAPSLDTRGQDLYLPLNYNNGVMKTDGKSVQLNSWILGVDESAAKQRSNQLSELEVLLGYDAVQIELRAQENVEVDIDTVRKVVEATS